MIKLDLLDHGVYLDGAHTADFENLDDAKAYAFLRVDNGDNRNATIINNFTGEIEYTADEKFERRVVEGE